MTSQKQETSHLFGDSTEDDPFSQLQQPTSAQPKKVDHPNDMMFSSTNATANTTPVNVPSASNASPFFDQQQQQESAATFFDNVAQQQDPLSLTQPYNPQQQDGQQQQQDGQHQQYDPNAYAQQQYGTEQQYDPNTYAQYDQSQWIQFDPNVHYYYDEQGGVHYYDPNTNQEYDMSQYYDENGQYQYDPQYSEYYAQQSYDPNAAQQAYDPNTSGTQQVYDPNSQQAYDPNSTEAQQVYQNYDPNVAEAQQTYQNYDPNATQQTYQSYDPSAQQSYNPNAAESQQAYDPSVTVTQQDPNVYDQYAPTTDQQAYTTPANTSQYAPDQNATTTFDYSQQQSYGQEEYNPVAFEFDNSTKEENTEKTTQEENSVAFVQDKPGSNVIDEDFGQPENVEPVIDMQSGTSELSPTTEQDNLVAELQSISLQDDQQSIISPLPNVTEVSGPVVEKKPLSELPADKQPKESPVVDQDAELQPVSLQASTLPEHDVNDVSEQTYTHVNTQNEQSFDFSQHQAYDQEDYNPVSFDFDYSPKETTENYQEENSVSFVQDHPPTVTNAEPSVEPVVDMQAQTVSEETESHQHDRQVPESQPIWLQDEGVNQAPDVNNEATQDFNDMTEQPAQQYGGYEPYQPTDNSTGGYEPYQPTDNSTEQKPTDQQQQQQYYGGYGSYEPTAIQESTNSYEPYTAGQDSANSYEPYQPTTGQESTTNSYELYQPTTGQESTTNNYEPYQPTTGQDSTINSYEPYQTTAVQDLTNSYKPTTGQDSTNSYEPTTGQDSTNSYEPITGVDSTGGYGTYQPNTGVNSTSGYEPHGTEQPPVNQQQQHYYSGYYNQPEAIERSATVPLPVVDRMSSPRPQLMPCPDPLCEGENKPKAKFCCECGRPLAGISRSTTPAANFSPTSFGGQGFSPMGEMRSHDDLSDRLKESLDNFLPSSVIAHQDRDIEDKRQKALDYIQSRTATFEDSSKTLLWNIVKLMLEHPTCKLGDG